MFSTKRSCHVSGIVILEIMKVCHEREVIGRVSARSKPRLSGQGKPFCEEGKGGREFSRLS